MNYQVELVWNRSFSLVPYGEPKETLEEAIHLAKALKNMGDGARVKKAQVINIETGEVIKKSYEI